MIRWIGMVTTYTPILKKCISTSGIQDITKKFLIRHPREIKLEYSLYFCVGSPFNCFDATQYGTLLIVDPEEEYFPEEISKIKRDVDTGLSIIIFGDWYNVTVMKRVKFYDENTRQWWMLDTGGAYIPALNDLLALWRIELGNKVFDGQFEFGDHKMYNASGTSIAKFPDDGVLIAQKLKDQGQQILDPDGDYEDIYEVPILGLMQSRASDKSGQIVVYGDSNCIDASHMDQACYWMLDAILQYTSSAHMPLIFKNNHMLDNTVKVETDVPERMEGNKLYRYSKVLDNHSGGSQAKALPQCPYLA